MVGSVPFILSLCKATLALSNPTSAVSYQENWRPKRLDEANAEI